MFRAKIQVTSKKNVSEPHGSTVKTELEKNGFTTISSLRIGKYIEVDFTNSDREIVERKVEEICDKLLVNSVVEKYDYIVEELK